MKTWARILLIISIAGIGYGYWGTFTRAGSAKFDEMDGYFPFLVMVAGLIFFLIAIVMFVIYRRRHK